MRRDEFGADLLINSRVPVGGGLSPSAALEQFYGVGAVGALSGG